MFILFTLRNYTLKVELLNHVIYFIFCFIKILVNKNPFIFKVSTAVDQIFSFILTDLKDLPLILYLLFILKLDSL